MQQQQQQSKSSTRGANSAPIRMRSAMQHAFSQPKRETKAFEIDPQWQRKVVGTASQGKAPSTVFRPTTSAGMNRAGNGGYSSGGMGDTAQRRQTMAGQPASSKQFDAKGFLSTQRKGQFLKRQDKQTSTGNERQQTQQPRQTQQQQSTQRQNARTAAPSNFAAPMTIEQATNSFDIERFKAMQPRKKMQRPVVAQMTEHQKQLLEQQRQAQSSRVHKQIKPERAAPKTINKEKLLQGNDDNNNTDNNIQVDEQEFDDKPLPWQTANDNVAARARIGKAATSKDVLRQLSAIKQQTAATALKTDDNDDMEKEQAENNAEQSAVE